MIIKSATRFNICRNHLDLKPSFTLSSLRTWSLIGLLFLQADLPAIERETDRLNEDVVNSLVKAGRLDDAIWFCERVGKQSPVTSVSHARWIGKLAIVRSEKEAASLYEGRSSELAERLKQSLENATASIDEFLKANPDFKAAEFLTADKITASYRILRVAMIVASVSSQSETNTATLLRQVSQLQRACVTLEKLANDNWAIANDATRQEARGISADQWERLGRELSIRQVALAILQTELFPPGTPDYASAAANAVTAAVSALERLPDDAPIKVTARKLHVDALLRSGDIEGARRNFLQLKDLSDDQASPALLALDAKIKLAGNEVSQAKRLIESFYSRQSNVTSLEMDFVKLDMLLEEDSSGQSAGHWLRHIEERGGAFARRRAETIIVRRLKGLDSERPTDSTEQTKSASILAAQGEDWLRKGDFDKAAQLLRNAAEVANGAEAIQLAAKSAAAAIKDGDSRHAAETLRAIALDNSEGSGAFDLAAQAALLLSKPVSNVDDAVRVTELETLLQEISQTWPGADQTPAIASWLCNIYKQSGRDRDAAEFALQWFTLRKDATSSNLVESMWFELVKGLPNEQSKSALKSLSQATCEIAAENPQLVSTVLPLAALLFDNPEQLNVETTDNSDSTDPLVDAIWNLRTLGQGHLEFTDVTESRLQRARWRLERDLSTGSTFVRAIAKQLQRWPNATPWQRAKVEFWLSEDQASINSIAKIVMTTGVNSVAVEEAMRLLSQSENPFAKKTAAQLADRVATSLPLRSERWYEAKINAIKWIYESGDVQEAGKRASFLMLVHPPDDERVGEQVQRYREPQ